MESMGGSAAPLVPGVTRRAPAKINLWLEVIRKREDGYHDLSSLMLPVDIHDDLEVTPSPGAGIRLRCDPGGLPRDRNNLAWRAAESFFELMGEAAGVDLLLRKRIPVGAGMGGGSSDAAAVLLALEELFPGRVSRERLHEAAARLGADVPFFLDARPALATGIGERLEPVAGVPPYPLVLIKPAVEVATAHVYKNLRLTRGSSRIKLRAFMDRPWDLQDVLENDLESVTVSEHSELREIKGWLLDQGSLGALMSGSGPTVFGVFRDFEAALRASEEAKRRWRGCWVVATRVLTEPHPA